MPFIWCFILFLVCSTGAWVFGSKAWEIRPMNWGGPKVIVKNTPFRKDVFGIIIANFEGDAIVHGTSIKGKDIPRSMKTALNARFENEHISGVEVQEYSKVLRGSKEALSIGRRYNAELVIFGGVNVQGIIYNLKLVKELSWGKEILKAEGAFLKEELSFPRFVETSDIQLRALTSEPASLVSFISGVKSFQNGSYEQAIQYFLKAIPQEEGSQIVSAPIFIALADSYFLDQEYDNAIINYTKVLDISPKKAGIYVNRGTAYFIKGDFNKAVLDYSKALGIDSSNASAYANRASVYFKMGDYVKSISDSTEALRINPKDAATFCNRGSAYSRSGDYELAIKDFNQALALVPKFASAYYNRAIVYFRKKDYDQAILDCSRALEIDPQYVDAYSQRGKAFYAKGEYDKAIFDDTEALKISPENSAIYLQRGEVYGEKGEHDKAINDFSEALRFDSKNKNAYSNRAIAYFNKKEYQKSLDDANAVQRLGGSVNPVLLKKLQEVLSH